MSREWSGLLYGVAYYNEYHQDRFLLKNGITVAARTEEDFALMRSAGVSVIRVGESVWQKWQPEPDSYDLDWLEPILDLAKANGISVIIGTPTYAVPRWVFLKHPDVIAHSQTGVAVPYGHRQNVDYSSQSFRALCEPLIRKIVQRYRDHPSVIGWQIDNEPGAYLLHNDGVFESFKESLRAEYGSVESLNSAWGLTYWSHALSNFDDLWRPDGNTNPSYMLAWRKHQAKITNDFLDWQRSLVRSLVPESQFITTCVALNRLGMDNQTIGEALDVTSVNVYYATQDGLAHPAQARKFGEQIAAPVWVTNSGASALNLICDTSRGIKQENFLVTETNGSSISQGQAMAAFPHYPGQFKQAAINMVSRGAELVEYWHWHTLPFGIENHWGGILPHSLRPGRTYNAFSETAIALKAISSLGRLTPAAEVALVVSTASRWAFEYQGPLRGSDGLVDPQSYEKTLHSVYEIAYSAGLGVQVIGDNQLPLESVEEFVAKHPAMILHSVYAVGDEVLRFALEYAEAGGQLLVTPRTGFAKPDNVVRLETQPGGLAEVLGAEYSEFTNLGEPIEVLDSEGIAVGSGYGWLDEIEVVSSSTKVLARLNHLFWGQYAALSEASHGKGCVTYLATYPDYQFASWIGQYLANAICFLPPIKSSSPSIVVNRAFLEDNSLVLFVFNWSWQPGKITLVFEATDVEHGTEYGAGSSIELAAWEVRVLKTNQRKGT